MISKSERIGVRPYVAALILPPLTMMLVFFATPLIVLLYVSFMAPSDTQLFGSQATVANYIGILGDPFYLLIIRRTLLSAAAILAACLVLGYPVAMVVARMRPRYRLLMLMVLLFPLMVSNVVRAYGWITILGREGMLNTVLVGAGTRRFSDAHAQHLCRRERRPADHFASLYDHLRGQFARRHRSLV